MIENAFGGDFEIIDPEILVSEKDTSTRIDTRERQETLREHLDARFSPIVVCVGTDYMYAGNLPEKVQTIYDPLLARQKKIEGDTTEMLFKLGVDNINYSATDEEKRKYQMNSSGPSEYVVSSVNTLDKYSGGFLNCFGMIVVGQDNDSGENISFGLHTPLYDVSGGNKQDIPILHQMKVDLNTRLKEMKEKCVPGSIDAVILGGFDDRSIRERNNKLLGFLGNAVDTALNFHPVFIAGEKDKNSEQVFGSDAIFFESKDRRLFLIRPEYTEGQSQPNRRV